ncbi:NPCBM/NEW2 domain-containing protein [Saccharopolyspora erythraea]|uniref:NPCBM/NEW2 domain-containing protein n=1 Tax=Saccharopolyspora erythraea TaxID=1836 RepID=UPI001BABA47D|nr:NPCBM/NEW2 domain-containing protein [Saccharopolyspora erythraea]QUG99837.1 NPCBM/NEW2 domain-containing protein [Saccharopolyspora erythraea]
MTLNGSSSPHDDGGNPVASGKGKRRTSLVLIALALVCVAVLAAYLTGRQHGSQAAPAPTVTVAAPPATTSTAPSTTASTSQRARPTTSATTRPATSPPSPSGEIYLTDRSPVEGGSSVEVGSATVRFQEYPRALLFESTSGSVSYNIDPGMRTFRALVGLQDSSASCSVAFDVKVDGTTVRKENVVVGQTVELIANVGGGFRLTVAADDSSGCSGVYPVVINPVLRAD